MLAPNAAPADAFTSPLGSRIYANNSPLIILTSCSVISDIAVGFMFCRPWKYPLRAESIGTNRSAGAIALTAGAASALPKSVVSGFAPRKHIKNSPAPSKNIIIIEM